MKKEVKYSIFFSSTLIFSGVILFVLFDKYTSVTMEHFLQTCQQMYVSFFDSAVHVIGTNLLLLTFLLAFILLTKVLFSVLKTRSKVSKLLKSKTDIPEKIKAICLKNNIDQKYIKIIESGNKTALAYGFFDPKIIISTKLVKDLLEKELEAVILHEYYHAVNKHPLILISSEIISSTIFFLPFIKDVMKKTRQEFEILADKYVTTKQKSSQYLESAIQKVRSTSNEVVLHYPSLTTLRKNEKVIGKKSIMLSTLSIIIGLLLLLAPIGSHVKAYEAKSDNEYCEGLCSQHCITDDDFLKATYPASFN